MIAKRSTQVLLLATAGILAVTAIEQPAELAASSSGPFADNDNDLIPDSIEWQLLTNSGVADTDSDGTDDFLEVVQFEAGKSYVAPLPMDHEARLTVSATGGYVYTHLMMRIVPGENIQLIDPYLHFNGTEYPIGGLLWNTVVDVKLANHPVEGTYVVVTSAFCSLALLEQLVPCAVGFRGQIGTKSFENGSVLQMVDGVVAALAPLPDSLYQQFTLIPIEGQEPLAPNGSSGASFWESSKACEITLVPVGGGGGSVVVQAVDARCAGAPTLRCAPSCSQQSGELVVVPGGIPFLTGN